MVAAFFCDNKAPNSGLGFGIWFGLGLGVAIRMFPILTLVVRNLLKKLEVFITRCRKFDEVIKTFWS